MTESELLETELLTKCDNPNCTICTFKATTLEMLMEQDCEE